MKVPESWLRDWVDPALDTEALGHELTMLGHEVDGIERQGAGLDGVVIAEVLDVRAHPDADRLSVCTVSAGSSDPVVVVCGAPNVKQGMKAALAVPGVELPNGVKLRRAKIRGVESNGMLCSAVELGLGEESDGILVLPADATTGMALARYLELPDAVFDLNLTPNRGDCFSVLGIARDVAALTGATLANARGTSVPPQIGDVHPVELPVPEGCPVFAGRVVRGIDPAARSPLWMVERLRRAGHRPIHPVVDVTNYVMLELGQPLHAYDYARIKGTLRPRLANAGESLVLLDGKRIELRADTTVVTDASGVIGLAGIMGGLSTAVSDATTDVYFEAAWWPPAAMAGQARGYGLHTDASLRFERGVDPTGQGRAVERATQLLLGIAGGRPGPLDVTSHTAHLPDRNPILLRRDRIGQLLGVEIDATTAHGILERLGFDAMLTDEGWLVRPPPHRFDIAIEADLIEEVARIYGYDRIPERTGRAELPLAAATETQVTTGAAAMLLVAREYREVITYSFVGAEDDAAISGAPSTLVLTNPISSEMAVMRSSLWSGMLRACAGNLSRQQDRVRLFEIGRSYHGAPDAPFEILRIGGLLAGPALPEQWGAREQAVDFFDIKSDVSALLALGRAAQGAIYLPAEHPALQPGQSASITIDGREVGVLGKLHPRVAHYFDIRRPVFLFELDHDAALAAQLPAAEGISRFPVIRRDIAVLVREEVTAEALVGAIRETAREQVRAVRIFDVYRGPGVEAGLKSVAIGLILQETSRTLTDDDADAAQAAAVEKLRQEFAAVLRD